MSEVNFLLLLGLALLLGAIIIRNTSQREMLFQYPILMALVCVGWVMPQLIGLYNTEQVPSDALAKTVIFIAFCLVAALFGFSSTRKVFPMARWELSSRRLEIGALLLMLFGFYFYLRFLELAAEATALYGGFWTGQITIFYFFSTTLNIGFICALAANTLKPTWLNRGMILLGVMIFLQRIIVFGRREAAIELFTISLLFIWRKYHWMPGRLAFFGAAVAGTLFITTISQYRNLMINYQNAAWSGATLSDVLSIDFMGKFRGSINDPLANQELKNAVLQIGASDTLMSFDAGLSLWNHLVFSYVPAQIVGANVKAALMFDLPPATKGALDLYGHVPWAGATYTGFAIAFGSFWYFGAFVFFVIGYVMRRWTNAFFAGSTTGLIMLMMLTSQSLMSITHTTNDFASVFVPIAAFLMPVLKFSRLK